MTARRFTSIVFLLMCITVASVATRPQAQTRTEAVVAIRNATILTATKGTIRNGTIVLRSGKIAAVGANVTVPAGADVVDGTGKFVSPGIIDCHSHIAADSINEGGTTVSSMTGTEDVFDRSEERRVGKECRSGWRPDELKKKYKTRKSDGKTR